MVTDKLDFAYVPAGLDRLIRPPGAVDEKAFVAGCIRCYRCQDACIEIDRLIAK